MTTTTGAASQDRPRRRSSTYKANLPERRRRPEQASVGERWIAVGVVKERSRIEQAPVRNVDGLCRVRLMAATGDCHLSLANVTW
jgi:hypothetical protein